MQKADSNWGGVRCNFCALTAEIFVLTHLASFNDEWARWTTEKRLEQQPRFVYLDAEFAYGGGAGGPWDVANWAKILEMQQHTAWLADGGSWSIRY